MQDEPAMTSVQLQDLLDRVKAASGPDRELDAEIACQLRCHPYGPFHWLDKSPEAVFAPTYAGWVGFTLPGEDAPRGAWASPEYTASIDAILALIERELSGHMGGFEPCLGRAFYGKIILVSKQMTQLMTTAKGATPALALCAAFLAAKIAEVSE